MLFNSIEFLVYLPIVFTLYWVLQRFHLKFQNLFLILASYIFYSWWDWRFLSLIVISSSVDFFVGLLLGSTEDKNKRNMLLYTSILVNLGLLGLFKYFNFFVDNFIDAFLFFGNRLDIDTVKIILPVGISFYTFQTLSYTIDIHKGKIKPTTDVLAFFAFISFFPQLVAGPIERANTLLPQFLRKRRFDYEAGADGIRQIIWGLFKKTVVADNCAVVVDNIFSNYHAMSGSTLLLGLFLFAFQIYGDFSGYSDMAIGIARLFGFQLMTNFLSPYFSRNIGEFWRRWHISLTSWFRDYLYIPLGGNRGVWWVRGRNTLIVFMVSGLWHGANWTFIAWGVMNALYFLPSLIFKTNRKYLDTIASGRNLPSFNEMVQMILTFTLISFSWVFFRSESIGHAFSYLNRIFSHSLFTKPEIFPTEPIFFVIILIIVEWINREREHALQIGSLRCYVRRAYYLSLFIIIFFYANFDNKQFIYFQF